MYAKSILVALIVILAGCSSGRTLTTGSVAPVGSKIPTEHGLWYYLPETVVRVEIIAEKRVEKAGPFFRFAQRFLNITDVITENREGWHIVGARVTTVGQPDKNRMYRISTTGTPSLAAVSLNAQGVLQGINLDYVAKESSHADSPKSVITLADVNFNDAPLTEEQLIRSSTTAMAEEVAKEIYRLREMRTNILKGDVDLLPPDKGSYEIVLEEIARQEAAYLALFKGRIETQRVSAYYDFVPDAVNPLNTVLLRFSSQSGFLDKMDVSGTPVYIEVEVDEKQIRDFVAAENGKTANTRGLVYRMPVPAEVRVIDRTLLLVSEHVLLGQFGQTLRLPADLLDNQGVKVELDQATGALKKISFK